MFFVFVVWGGITYLVIKYIMQDMLFLTILILTFLLVELIVMIVFLKFYFSEHEYTYSFFETEYAQNP